MYLFGCQMSKHTQACVNGSTHLAFLEVLKTKMSNPVDVRISFLLSTIITYLLLFQWGYHRRAKQIMAIWVMEELKLKRKNILNLAWKLKFPNFKKSNALLILMSRSPSWHEKGVMFCLWLDVQFFDVKQIFFKVELDIMQNQMSTSNVGCEEKGSTLSHQHCRMIAEENIMTDSGI